MIMNKLIPFEKIYIPKHKKRSYQGADYMSGAMKIEIRREVIALLKDMITRSKLQFDTIAFRGMSGALVGSIISHEMGIPFAVIRKEKDSTHSESAIDGPLEIGNYIIIDDFISSGTTIRMIINTIRYGESQENLEDSKKHGVPNPNAKCIGIFLYDIEDSRTPTFDGIPCYEIVVHRSAGFIQEVTVNQE